MKAWLKCSRGSPPLILYESCCFVQLLIKTKDESDREETFTPPQII